MPKKLLNKQELAVLPKGFKRVLEKKTFKIPALTLVMMLLALGFSLSDADVEAYAATTNFAVTTYASTIQATQSARWVGSGDRWQVSDNHGGYIKNCWFQDDVTGHWYMLGAEDGSVMYSGLVTDQSTGKSYLLNINHDGTFGRMLTVNGVYNVNGKDVYMTFNQEHYGEFGAILSGLAEVRSTGVNERKLDRIPTDEGNASASSSQSNNTNPSNGNGTYVDSNGFVRNESGGVSSIFTDDLWKETSDANKYDGGGSLVDYNWN